MPRFKPRRRSGGAWLPVLGVLSMTSAGVARAQPAPPNVALDGRTLRIAHADGTAAGALELECDVRSAVVDGGTVFVACGLDGVLVVDVADPTSPTVRARLTTPAEVVGIFVRNRRVWVEQSRTEAVPLDELPQWRAGLPDRAPRPLPAPTPSTPTAEAAPPSPPAAEPEAPPSAPARPTISPARPAPIVGVEGRVLRVEPNEVVIDIGSDAGLRLGDHVQLVEIVEVDSFDGRTMTRERSLSVGAISAISADRARVTLGLGEHAPVGAVARPTIARTTERRGFPPRIAGMTELEATIRPFLPIGRAGFGAMADLSATYRAEKPYFLRVSILPLGFGASDGSAELVAGGVVLVGYDTRNFELGTGVGVLRATFDREAPEPPYTFYRRTRPAFASALAIRIGARDGLHLRVTNTLVLGEATDGGRRYEWGSVDAALQIPVGRHRWGLVRGGGSSVGRFAFAELGLRTLLRGDGGPKSIFLVPSAGFAWVIATVDDTDEGDHDRIGPSVGITAEWRL